MGIWMEGLTPAQITFRLASICLFFRVILGGPTQLPCVHRLSLLSLSLRSIFVDIHTFQLDLE